MLVILRMLLRIQKCLSADYVKLHMHTLLVKVGTDQCYKFLQAFSSGKCRWMEFLVKQSTIGNNEMIQLGNRACGSGRTIYILACGRRYPVCNRCMGISSIRSGACLSTQRNIGRYRIKTCMETASSWVAILLDRPCICISNISAK